MSKAVTEDPGRQRPGSPIPNLTKGFTMRDRLDRYLVMAITVTLILAGSILSGFPDAILPARHDHVAQAGPVRDIFRWIFHRRHHVEPTPDPTPEPTPDPTPDPTPPPPVGQASVVAVWDTFAMPDAWSSTARSHALAEWLTQRSVAWTQLDPATASQLPPPPAWAQSIFAAAIRDKLAPPYLYVLPAGQPARPHQLTPADTLETVKEKIADDLPPKNLQAPTLPLSHGTGLLKRRAPFGTLKANGQPVPSLAAKLRPLPPAEYPTCDLRTSIPFIDDQRTTSLCTSFAVTLLTEQARFVQFGPTNQRRLSAASVANQINGWSGASLTDAITALTAHGCLPESATPELSHRLPDNWQATAAGYRWIKWYDAPSSDPLGYTCAALARGYPAIVGIGVGSSFEPDGHGFISYAKGSGRGGHAIVVCGHDNHASPKRSLIANSWGHDWGDHGFAWIEDTFISKTDYDGPYVCTAVTIAPTDVGPTIPNPAPSPGTPLDNLCPAGTCPYPPKPVHPSLIR